MNRIDVVRVAGVFFALVISIVGCGKGGDTTEEEVSVISIRGSDTIVNLAQTLSEEYMKDNENAQISVTVEVLARG